MLLIQLTASHGPAECEHAVRLTLRELLRDCAASGIAVDVLEETPTPAGYKSVLLRCEGDTGLLHGTLGAWLGTIMLLNVWGIIWPNNKRILAATAGTGPAAPPELARQAFIASRTNAWLSLPMLLFMATSHGDWVMFGR